MSFKGSNKQIIKNILSNGVNFCISLINGLLITPLILNKLGKDPFVIIQITISISMYASLIANSINESLTLILALKKDYTKDTIYSTASFVYSILFVISIPIILFISINAKHIFNISDEYLNDSQYLLALNLISFMFIILTNYFTTPIYLNNRVDICQQIISTRNIIRTVLIIISIYFIQNAIIGIGFSYFLSAFTLLLFSYYLFKKSLFGVKITISNIEKNIVKKLTSLGGWSLIFQLGILIFAYGDVIIASFLLDNDNAANLSALLQWRVLVYSLISLFLQVFHPIFLNLMEGHDTNKIKFLFLKGIRYLGVLGSILCAIIFVYTKEILLYWLGEEYVHLSGIFKLVIFYWGVNSAFTLFKSIYLIYDKIKLIAILSISTSILHLALSYILIIYYQIGIYGIVYSSMIMLLVRNLILYPIFSSHFSKIKLKDIIIEVLKICFSFIVIILINKLSNLLIPVNSLSSLILSAGIIGTMSLVILAPFIISNEDKRLLKNKIWRFF